jgi:hypothetical protein
MASAWPDVRHQVAAIVGMFLWSMVSRARSARSSPTSRGTCPTPGSAIVGVNAADLPRLGSRSRCRLTAATVVGDRLMQRRDVADTSWNGAPPILGGAVVPYPRDDWRGGRVPRLSAPDG